MEMKKKTAQEILENYALGKNTVKWINAGGDILKYIGADVIKVRFTKETPEDNWRTETTRVFIVSIKDFDPLTGTYMITYRDVDKTGEVTEERIIPEGFSYNNPEEDKWMNRFLPMSLHFKITEEEIFYNRLRSLYDRNDGINIKAIEGLKNTNQSESLGYHNYIAAIIDSDVEGGLGIGIISFRIYEITNIQPLSKTWSFGVKDKFGNYFPIKLESTDTSGIARGFSVNGVIIGDLKIMDIEDNPTPTPSVEEIN